MHTLYSTKINLHSLTWLSLIFRIGCPCRHCWKTKKKKKTKGSNRNFRVSPHFHLIKFPLLNFDRLLKSGTVVLYFLLKVSNHFWNEMTCIKHYKVASPCVTVTLIFEWNIEWHTSAIVPFKLIWTLGGVEVLCQLIFYRNLDCPLPNKTKSTKPLRLVPNMECITCVYKLASIHSRLFLSFQLVLDGFTTRLPNPSWFSPFWKQVFLSFP